MGGYETRSGKSGSIRFVPFAILTIFILLDGLPGLGGWIAHLELGLFFIPLFYIGLHAENDFTPVAVLALGVLCDVLGDAPIGFWGVLFCVMYVLAVSQKQILQNADWGSYWTSFIVLVAATYLVGYLIALMRSDIQVAAGLYFVSAMVTGLVFPFIYYPLNWIQADDGAGFSFRGDN